MAEKLKDPRFTRFTEDAGPTDFSSGIASLGKLAKAGVTEVATSSLSKKVGGERQDFLQLLVDLKAQGIDPDTARFAEPKPGDVIELDVGTILQDAKTATEVVTANTAEVDAMTGELAGVRRATEQGITPPRALEINVEAITRRYIDRFPGLSRQFQQVAAAALGTSNNLLSATMRTFEEQARAAAAAASDEEGFIETLAEFAPELAFQIKFHATEAGRRRAIADALVLVDNKTKLLVLESQSELNEIRGDPTVAAENFINFMVLNDKQTMIQYHSDLVNALPPHLQRFGVQGLGSSIGAATPEERAEIESRLEQAKALAIRQSDINIESRGGNPENLRAIESRKALLVSLYDNAIESMKLGRVNDNLKFELDILINTNARDFEAVLGKDALIVEKFIALTPPGSSLHNRFFNSEAQEMIAPKMLAFMGTGEVSSILQQSGIAPTSPDGKAMMDVFNTGNVQALRTAIFDPTHPGLDPARGYDPRKSLASMDFQFKTASPESKTDMLNLVGEDEFLEFFRVQDPQTRIHMRSLAEQAAQWGAISIGRLQEELIRDISEPLMRRRFGVETEGQGGFQSASGDSPTKGVVTTGDLITLVNDPQRGLLAKAVPVSKLIELGVKVDERNLANLNKMILDLNRKLIVGLNAYARAIGKLEPGQTRSGIIDDIKALMRGVEPPPSPAN